MKDEQQASLDRINGYLEQIKEEINKHWGPEANPKNEVALFIQDRMYSPGRKQVEDIEGDVNDMRMMSR